MYRLSTWLAPLIILTLSLAAADAGARRKRRKHKKRSKARVEQPLPPAESPPVEPPPAEPPPAEPPAVEPPPAGEPPAVETPVEPTLAPPAVQAAPPQLEAPASTALSPEAGKDRPPESAEAEVIEAHGAGEPSTRAEMPSAAAPAPDKGRAEVFPLTVSLELGTSFSQVLSKLETSFIPTLEVGVLLPWVDQHFEVLLGIAYITPAHSDTTVSDPRLDGDGSYRFRIIEHEFLTHLGVQARLFPPRSFLNLYAAAAFQLHWQRSDVGGRAAATGEVFGKNSETKVEGAALLAAGSELALGPGAVALELAFSFAGLNHRITGSAGAGGLILVAGYHLLL